MCYYVENRRREKANEENGTWDAAGFIVSSVLWNYCGSGRVIQGRKHGPPGLQGD
ncbi:hypothetical protein GCM10009865_52860 [Aeromicrobium ponti]